MNMLKSLSTAGCLSAVCLMVACTPTVQVAVPDEPIEINLNVKIEHGCAIVPTAPGLGVEPDRAVIKEFCVQTTEKNNVG